jgi:hypothetical protein
LLEVSEKLEKKDKLGEKKTLTEVDVLLYGDTEVMAVETKSHLVTRIELKLPMETGVERLAESRPSRARGLKRVSVR